jgi:antitoxin component of MazEF toxin-antitoxin module
MSQEPFITFSHSATLLLPKEILDMLSVDVVDEVEVSVKDRTLTARPPQKKRIAGLNRGMISMGEDFDAPLSDKFWLGRE